MDTLGHDIRYAFRRLIKSPAFTVVALLTLALGIGANTAIFSVVNAVLLQPLPYKDPHQIVGLYHLSEGRRAPLSGPNFTDVRKLNTTLRDAAAYTRSRTILTGRGEPVRLDGAEVSASLFDLLGVAAHLGRTFRADENEPGKTHVAILSYALWQQRFGGDPAAVGKRLTLDGVAHEIVGVMPDRFSFPAARAIWTPLEYSENLTTTQRGAWYLQAVGRTRPGVSVEQVRAEIETIGRQLAKQYPDSNEGVDISAVSLHEAMVGDLRTAFWILLGAVGFVLLIACVNVANLLLARAASRESEIAVRAALGAGRWRLIRQLLTESLILSLVGGALGLLLAVWGVEALIALEPQGVPRLGEVRVDVEVIGFTMGLALITGLLFGAVPAFQSTRSGISTTLKEGARGALTTRGGARMRTTLVVAEVALAVTLLAGAGLLIRSFSRLASVDPGFRVQEALTFEVSLPDARYTEEAQQVAFFDALLPRLEAIPGVEAAAAVLSLPLSGSSIVLTFEVAGRPPVPPSQQPAMQVRVATPQYFQTIGIPLRKGRFFSEDDRSNTPPVVLITEAAAKQYFRNEDPLGKKITLGWGRGPNRPRAGGEVVGVIGDIKDAGLDEPDPPQIYLAYRQWPVQGMSLVLKTAVPAGSVAEPARRAVYSLDGNLPVANVRTLEELVARSISQPRFYMTLLAVFAGVALTLAAIGIFGVLSYAVAQRTREIGIRMALGARQRAVLGLIVREAMVMASGGVLIGVVAAFLLTEWLVAQLLFDTSPHDPATFVAVAGLLAVVSLAAAYVPARRAARVDPIVALRAD
ncbi:MAG TPA: ABC transporter permease [Vicinamibacterales bacterium]|nr:ABC transporter permease [Vicinamibacterales bacterium]